MFHVQFIIIAAALLWELPLEVISNSRIFHFGTLSMTREGGKAACKAIDCAKAGGSPLSFDPNLRPPLWGNLEEARTQISYGLARCDILKIADNELEFMTGETDFDWGAAILREKYPNIRLLNVTAVAEGSHSYYEDKQVFVPACKLGGVIETTGAGDTFCACVLDFVGNIFRGMGQLSRVNGNFQSVIQIFIRVVFRCVGRVSASDKMKENTGEKM